MIAKVAVDCNLMVVLRLVSCSISACVESSVLGMKSDSGK
jgi:hypothetical protein